VRLAQLVEELILQSFGCHEYYALSML